MKFWLRDFNIPHFTAFQAIFTLYTELWTSKLVKILTKNLLFWWFNKKSYNQAMQVGINNSFWYANKMVWK